MNFRNALAGVAVSDIAAAIEWYEALVGRPPDIRPLPHVAGWQFPGGGWVEVFVDKERAGKSTVIFAVLNTEKQLEELAARNIPIIYETPSEEIGEVAMVEDPDGNRIVLAGPLTGVMDD